MQSLRSGYLLQNRYKITKILGKGGFGITYLVYDTKNANKKLVIKEFFWSGQVTREANNSYIIPHKNNDNEYNKLLKAFQREANITFKLKHPSIVNVIDGFQANNTAYYIMEYVEGETLQEKMKKEKKVYSQREIIEIISPILDGLEYIHSLGYLHRDMAPDNIYLKNYNDAIIIDFGSSRRVIGEHTQSITTLVKHGYSPPEQYTGTTKEQRNPSTDIYPISAIIYRMMSGKVPHSATDRQNSLFNDNIELIDDICEKFKEQYTPMFLKTVKKGLELRPRDRYQTITEFRDDLLKDTRTIETIEWQPNNNLPLLGTQCPPITQWLETHEIHRDNNEGTFNGVSSKYWMYLDKQNSFNFMKVVYLNNHSMNIDLNQLADEVRENTRKFFNVDNYTLAGAITEIDILSKLNHDNIIKIKKIDKHKGHLYVVYDLTTLEDFKTLEQCMSIGIKYDEKAILNFALTMLDTLKYLHQNDIIHGRIHPQNILIINNQPILFDFQFSVKDGFENLVTDVNGDCRAINCIFYGLFETTSPTFDIYSLGMILYKLIRNKNIPTSIERFREKFSEGNDDPLQFPEELNNHYSKTLIDAIKIATAIKPEDRFQSAQEMIDVLQKEMTIKKKNRFNPLNWLKK